MRLSLHLLFLTFITLFLLIRSWSSHLEAVRLPISSLGAEENRERRRARRGWVEQYVLFYSHLLLETRKLESLLLSILQSESTREAFKL